MDQNKRTDLAHSGVKIIGALFFGSFPRIKNILFFLKKHLNDLVIRYLQKSIPKKNWRSLSRLQLVQNAAAQVLVGARKRDHVTPIQGPLHWQPLNFRVKILLSLKIFKYSCNTLNFSVPSPQPGTSNQLIGCCWRYWGQRGSSEGDERYPWALGRHYRLSIWKKHSMTLCFAGVVFTVCCWFYLEIFMF